MSEKTIIGQVVGIHALGGEFKVKPLTDYPDRFLSMKKLPLYREDNFVRELSISRVRFLEGHKGAVFVFSCEEVSDPEGAQALVGCCVCVPDGARVPLPEGQYWIDDLIGMSVVESGELRGVVKDFVRSGGNELYIVEGLDGKERMIPAVDEFVKNIDLRTKTITVSLIEGLW